MKKILLIALLVNAWAGFAQAQSVINTAGALKQAASAPSGACSPRGAVRINASTVYVCPQSGTATWTTVGGSSVSGANPSASIGLTAVNGSATTFMRSDGAPALDVSIAPTWSGQHTFAAGTITTSKPISITQTWNAGGVTFSPLLVNVTDTASASASLLADFQVAGSSKASFNKDGTVRVGAGSTSRNGISFSSIDTGFSAGPTTPANQVVFNAAGTYQFKFGSGFLAMRSGALFGWQTSTLENDGYRLVLRDAAAANLAFGAADAASPVAQTLSVQNVIAGTTNVSGADWTHKGSAGTGTGAAGKMLFQLAGAGSSGTAQNPFATVLQLDAGASNATGLEIKGNAAGSGVTLSALSSGTNENLNLAAKGSGDVRSTVGAFESGNGYFKSPASTNLNIYAGTGGFISFSPSTAESFRVTTSAANFASGVAVGLGSTSSPDLGIARISAGILRVTSGSTGAGKLLIGTSSDTSAAQLDVRSQATGTPAVQFQCASGESATANCTQVKNGAGTTILGFRQDGSFAFDRTMTTGGTTGAQTINKAAFSVNFAAAATSLVVTNSVVTTTSGCLCTVQTNDATMSHVQAVPGSGSVTLYANAAPTGETKVYCEVRN